MKIKMKVGITGTRNGDRWPVKGDTIDVPSAEAQTLVANGLAEIVEAAPAPVKPVAEKAVAKPTGEKRASKPKGA